MRRAPLTLSCLEALFEHQRDGVAFGGVAFDAAVQALADLLGTHANQPEYDIEAADLPAQARRELREWIRRGLVTEREGGIHETDALKSALRQAILRTRQHRGAGGRTRCLAATQTHRSSGRLQPAGRRRRPAGVR